jgi:hypothetical protein
VRRAVLAVVLVHAVLGLGVLVWTAWSRRVFRWLPAPPASLMTVSPGGAWLTVYYVVNVAWIVIFVALVLGHYRTARVIAVLAIVPGLVALLQAQLTGTMPAPFGSTAWWVLLDLAPVLAMTAFHRDAPPAARRPWLLALPAGCLLVALACLAHAPRAWSRRAGGSGVWSLTLALLAAEAGT